MFRTRLISGIVLIAVLAFLLVVGGPLLWAAVLTISLVGLFELYRTYDLEKRPLAFIGYGAAVFYALLLLFDVPEIGMWFPVVLIFALAGLYVLTFPKYRSDQMMLVFFGVIYVCVMLFYLYLVRMLDDGFIVWLVVIGSWGCDTSAYCVGMLLGKHKLAPILSPKKSIEGAVGGIVGSALLGFLYGMIFAGQLMELFPHPAIYCCLICAAAAVVSQIGDLLASAIKRDHNIKDYGRLIPGHGGVLDRFDSVIFVAPVIYYLTLVFLAI